MGSATLLALTQILISIAVAIQALETLAARRLFASAGLYDWDVLSTNARWTKTGVAGAALNAVLHCPVFLVFTSLQLVASLVLLSGQLPEWSLTAVAVMLAVHMLFLLRNQYGVDGSDQMMLLVLAALFAYHLHPTGVMLTITFGFVVAQLMLSYLTSGIAKALSPTWRRGDAVALILNTRSYGSRVLSQFLLCHRWAALLACWGVVCYECCGPVLVWTHPVAALAFIAIGTMLHLMIGLSMGLNIFFWSFTSTYPAVYYFSHGFGLVGRF